MAVEVRRATVRDWGQIQSFVDDTYGPLAPYKRWPRAKWQFLDNPHAGAVSDALPMWIAVDGDLVVGAIGVQMASLHLRGADVPAGWVVDVMVRPSHRGGGLGHRIHAAVAADVPVLVTLTMAEATRRIAERAGCVTLGEGRQYCRLGTPFARDVQAYLLNRTQYRPWARRLASAACNLGGHVAAAPAVRLMRRRRALRLDAGVQVDEVSSFGADIDEMWDAARRDYGAVFCRSSSHLNWRFGSPPDLVYRRFVARRAGRTVGYSVLRMCLPVELRGGIIADLFCVRDDHDARATLIAHAVQEFGRGVAFVEAAASTGEMYQSFKSAGFVHTKTVRPTVVSSDPAVRRLAQESANDWYFTKGDHDWDQVHAL
jgi:hypothetical protein